MGQVLPVTLPKSPSTRKEAWAELRQKKKHDRVNARALTAAEAAEREAKQRDAKQRGKQKKDNEAAKQRDKQKENSEEGSEAIASLSPDPLVLPLFASIFVIMTFKLRGRPKGGKNLTSTTTTTTFNEPSPSSAPSVMTRTTKSGRAVKETTVWEQESQPRRRLRDPRWR